MVLGRVYKIECKDTGDVYYGSTMVKYLSNRKAQHISCVKRYDEGKTNKKLESYSIIKNNNYIFELLEENDFETKKDLLWRERFYIENNKCLNKQLPIQTAEERKECRIARDKKKSEDPEHLKKKRDNYHKVRNADPETYRAGRREYYNNNKDKINEKRRENAKKDRELLNQLKKNIY